MVSSFIGSCGRIELSEFLVWALIEEDRLGGGGGGERSPFESTLTLFGKVCVPRGPIFM